MIIIEKIIFKNNNIISLIKSYFIFKSFNYLKKKKYYWPYVVAIAGAIVPVHLKVKLEVE